MSERCAAPRGRTALAAIREESRVYLRLLTGVAATFGIGDDERMRRAFQRHLNVNPVNYCSRFPKEMNFRTRTAS